MQTKCPKNLKKNKYGERVLESEKGSFTPLVFNTSGGMGPECARLNKRLAELIAIKKAGKIRCSYESYKS